MIGSSRLSLLQKLKTLRGRAEPLHLGAWSTEVVGDGEALRT